MTGDMNLTKAEMKETHIIVSTPEKWDVVIKVGISTTFLPRKYPMHYAHTAGGIKGKQDSGASGFGVEPHDPQMPRLEFGSGSHVHERHI